MIRFLFWNLNRKPLEAMVANLVRQYGVDVLVLTECTVPRDRMLLALNVGSEVGFEGTFGNCDTVEIFVRFSREFITLLSESRRWTIRRVVLPARPEIMLVAAHAVSKLHWSPDGQSHECIRLAQTIRNAEAIIGHERTIFVGDLNMNPFESGVVSGIGLNAVMTRDIASRGTRTVQGRRYPFFYNPMWGHFGDLADGPPGTYYTERFEQTEYFWYMMDQVLVRPGLLEHFKTHDLEILTTDGSTSLLSDKGVPDGSVASDHLPIVFGLDL